MYIKQTELVKIQGATTMKTKYLRIKWPLTLQNLITGTTSYLKEWSNLTYTQKDNAKKSNHKTETYNYCYHELTIWAKETLSHFLQLQNEPHYSLPTPKFLGHLKTSLSFNKQLTLSCHCHEIMNRLLLLLMNMNEL